MTDDKSNRSITEEETLAAIAGAIKTLKEAVDQLVANYRPRLLKRIQRHIPSDVRLEADDVAQDASLKAVREIHSFQGEAFYGWLATIADNTLKETVRRQRTKKRGGGRKAISGVGKDPDFSAYVPLLDLRVVNHRGPASSLVRREAAAALQSVLPKLNPRQCAALLLCHVHDWPRERSADALGIEKAALGALLYRGLETLRKAMEDRETR